MKEKKVLRDGESNPGLPRDRRGYSPLYYRGDVHSQLFNIYQKYNAYRKVHAKVNIQIYRNVRE